MIACPTGGAEVAHQIVNTGTTSMQYLSLSTQAVLEVCEYLDSQNILVSVRYRGRAGLQKLFRAETAVDYCDREKP